jgi:hypothetical protein
MSMWARLAILAVLALAVVLASAWRQSQVRHIGPDAF